MVVEDVVVVVVVVVEVDVVDGTARVVGAVMRRPRTCTGLAVEATELAPGITLASPIADATRPSATEMVARRWRVMRAGCEGRVMEVYELDTRE